MNREVVRDTVPCSDETRLQRRRRPRARPRDPRTVAPQQRQHDRQVVERIEARRVPPERLRLVALSGPDRGREFALGRGDHIIGTDSEAVVSLRDRSVSRWHLELSISADRIVVRDLRSVNGSYYHQARFSSIEIESGAVLRIGETELRLLTEKQPVSLLPSTRTRFGQLAGASLPMRNLFAVLERAAPSDASILIEGETGSGKELCAEAIHQHSARAQRPFVVCDLGAAVAGLFESELFGHVRGAFTGAEYDRAGVFEQAHGGTLFLDEIGELPPTLQSRLVRAVDRRRVRRLGEERERTVDVRVIAATNRDLEAEVKAGRFREDLWRRLHIIQVRMPPLRDRLPDLPGLVEEMLRPHGVAISEAALGLLCEQPWPGNVRELRNALARAMALAQPGECIATSHLVDVENAAGLPVSPPIAAALERID